MLTAGFNALSDGVKDGALTACGLHRTAPVIATIGYARMPDQKHHYIPEFYLKQWAGPDGRLIEFCRRHNKLVRSRPTHPGGTGYSRGLYTIHGAPPHLKDIFESKFMSVGDGRAAESLRLMVDDHLIPGDNLRVAWAQFMMSLWYRTPEGVARSSEMIRKYYEEENLEDMRERYAAERHPDDPDTLQEYLKATAPLITSRTTIVHLMDIIGSRKVTEKIMSMRWYVVRMNSLRFSILTSDRPIVMTNGIAYDDSHIVMPLSPQHIFVAANTEPEVEKLKALSRDGTIAAVLNDRVVRQARKFVYSTDDGQLRFVENRLGEKAVCSPFE